MHAERKRPHGQATPATAALIVASLGVAGIVYQNLGSGNGPQADGDAATITVAAVMRAGAVQIPSQPRVGQSPS